MVEIFFFFITLDRIERNKFVIDILLRGIKNTMLNDHLLGKLLLLEFFHQSCELGSNFVVASVSQCDCVGDVGEVFFNFHNYIMTEIGKTAN